MSPLRSFGHSPNHSPTHSKSLYNLYSKSFYTLGHPVTLTPSRSQFMTAPAPSAETGLGCTRWPPLT